MHACVQCVPLRVFIFRSGPKFDVCVCVCVSVLLSHPNSKCIQQSHACFCSLCLCLCAPHNSEYLEEIMSDANNRDAIVMDMFAKFAVFWWGSLVVWL